LSFPRIDSDFRAGVIIVTIERSRENGHVISWQRRDVNLPPDPILKLMAVASCLSLYIIQSAKQRRAVVRPSISSPNQLAKCGGRRYSQRCVFSCGHAPPADTKLNWLSLVAKQAEAVRLRLLFWLKQFE